MCVVKKIRGEMRFFDIINKNEMLTKLLLNEN